MRVYHHVLEKSKSGKSVVFKVYIDDRFGRQTVKHASVSGWRCSIAEKYLSFDREDWDDDVARKYVGMMLLKAARDRYEGTRFLNHVRDESRMEIHFWAYQFLTNRSTASAWKTLYGDCL